MKKPFGPSLYYASDKNIFDALNQHKVNAATVRKLFVKRNVIVSKKTQREDLAKYFARLSHDYYDHRDIAERLGVAPRRERITSMDVNGPATEEILNSSINQLKNELEATGDIVHVSRTEDNLSLNIQYSTIDYKRSEFAQVQVRDGILEFIKSDDGYIVRNTQNEYLNNIRDTLLGKLDKSISEPLNRKVITLFDVPSSKLRSNFFYELASNLSGYSRRDVTEVNVYQTGPEIDVEDSVNDDGEDLVTHIERVFLRGNGVTQSELLNELLDGEDYYIIKIRWLTAEIKGTENVYEIEALFTDPKDCTGFSFILNGVYPKVEGKLSSKRRQPSKVEIDQISKVIENKARSLTIRLKEEYDKPNSEEE